MIKPKIAICLKGHMDKIKSGQFINAAPEEVYQNKNPYVKFSSVYESIKTHIVNCNPQFDFDFFIHCWALDLEKDLDALYKPKLSKYENQIDYKNDIESNHVFAFGYTAQQLGISKSLDLLISYIKQNPSVNYDFVVICRPDVILYKDMEIIKYNPNEIYVNCRVNEDFHFVMNQENAIKFKNIFGSKLKFPDFVEQILNKTLIPDDIICGENQEVLRKLRLAIERHNLNETSFYKYGLTSEDINLLTHE
jgi:hypothetical protein